MLPSVLFLLSKKAEPLLAVLFFAVFVAKGDAAGFAGARGDGGHRHSTAERPRASGRVLGSCRDGAPDGLYPGIHFHLKTEKTPLIYDTFLCLVFLLIRDYFNCTSYLILSLE